MNLEDIDMDDIVLGSEKREMIEEWLAKSIASEDSPQSFGSVAKRRTIFCIPIPSLLREPRFPRNYFSSPPDVARGPVIVNLDDVKQFIHTNWLNSKDHWILELIEPSNTYRSHFHDQQVFAVDLDKSSRDLHNLNSRNGLFGNKISLCRWSSRANGWCCNSHRGRIHLRYKLILWDSEQRRLVVSDPIRRLVVPIKTPEP